MFGLKLVDPPQEPSVEERYIQAELDVTNHVQFMKERREAFADPREIAALERKHWDLLNTWAGLKQQWEQEQKVHA